LAEESDEVKQQRKQFAEEIKMLEGVFARLPALDIFTKYFTRQPFE
jgi:hypothetical protein